MTARASINQQAFLSELSSLFCHCGTVRLLVGGLCFLFVKYILRRDKNV